MLYIVLSMHSFFVIVCNKHYEAKKNYLIAIQSWVKYNKKRRLDKGVRYVS